MATTAKTTYPIRAAVKLVEEGHYSIIDLTEEALVDYVDAGETIETEEGTLPVYTLSE